MGAEGGVTDSDAQQLTTSSCAVLNSLKERVSADQYRKVPVPTGYKK